MNKKLILKYKTEFDHWLNGGSVLYKQLGSNIWQENLLEWGLDESRYIVILNDEYVKFRKALAEGRQFQFFNTKERLYDSSKPLHTWQDTDTIRTHGIPSDYRIKPEPKFKAGDWVRNTVTNEVYQFAQTLKELQHTTNLYANTHWKPEPNEICIFWDSADNGAVISKFSRMEKEKYVTDSYIWNNCEPFMGQLPSFMKDNK